VQWQQCHSQSSLTTSQQQQWRSRGNSKATAGHNGAAAAAIMLLFSQQPLVQQFTLYYCAYCTLKAAECRQWSLQWSLRQSLQQQQQCIAMGLGIFVSSALFCRMRYGWGR
jgi:hypothetical protein